MALYQKRLAMFEYDDEWLKNDCSYMDMLRDTVDDFSKDLVKEAEQQKAQKKKHEPER